MVYGESSYGDLEIALKGYAIAKLLTVISYLCCIYLFLSINSSYPVSLCFVIVCNIIYYSRILSKFLRFVLY